MLPVGKTTVTFTATSPTNSSSVSCRLVIDVLDKEKPTMSYCPENIEFSLSAEENVKVVHWREPNFYDNVGIFSVYKSKVSKKFT